MDAMSTLNGLKLGQEFDAHDIFYNLELTEVWVAKEALI
jgi:hypothetical protein